MNAILFKNLFPLHSAASSRRRAFSEVECLLIFFGVLIPVVMVGPLLGRGNGVGCSVRSPCQLNMKALSLSVKQYAQDYDEQFPGGTRRYKSGTSVAYAGVGWAATLYPYIKDTKKVPMSPGPNQTGPGPLLLCIQHECSGRNQNISGNRF